VALGGPKQRALLALLLLHAGEAVAADRLIDELWGERPPPSARNSLQALVSRLRRALADPEAHPRIATRPAGYLLEVAAEQFDLARFERLCAEGRDALAANDAATAAARLREALDLWRGEPLADVAFEPFARSARDRLEETRVTALEGRIEADLALGRHAELVAELEALVKQHPVRERPVALLMLALYRSGRQAEALDAYRSARAMLVRELGLEPSRRLRDLESAILRQDTSLDAAAGRAPAVPPDGRETSAGPALVGRTRELDVLLGGLEAAFAGRGGTFLLSGEPGIGKSRLADELASAASGRGAQVLVGRCWEAGGAPAYWPWVQVIRSHLQRPEAHTLDLALGRAGGRPRLEPAAARFELFDAVCAVLRAAAAERPAVVVLDDLHAADEPSLLLLRFAAAQLERERVVIVGAYRDVDPTVGETLADALADLARRPSTTLLHLDGLSARDIGAFVRDTTGTEAVEGLVAAIHRRTEGNPLFVGELLRLIGATGRLDTHAIEATIPQGVHAVIERRLRHISKRTRHSLGLASILGRDFRTDLLAAMSERREDELLEMLDEAFDARLIGAAPGRAERLRFSHVLIRDVLYADLSPLRRAALHRRAGEVIVKRAGPAPEPQLAELAHHFALAGPDAASTAVDYARRAARYALELLAFEEAARLFEVALRALDERDDVLRCDLLLSLGEARARAGQERAAKESLLQAAGLAQATGEPEQLARAALGYGGRFVWARAGQDRRTVALLEDALRRLPRPDTPLRARVLARLAGALRDQRERERIDALSSEAVSIARRIGDPATLAYALDGRFAATMWPENPTERLAIADELLGLAEVTGDRERTVQARYYRAGMTMLELGDIRSVEDELDTIAAIADELRQPAQRWLVSVTRATLALFQGRFDEAEGLVAEALALGRLAQSSDAVLSHRVQIFTLRWQRGALDGLRELLERSIRDYPARPMFRCMLALLHAEEGRDSDALRQLDALAADRFAALPLTNEWLFSTGFLAEAAHRLATPTHAATIYELLAPYADRNASTADYICTGSVSRFLALAAATMRRWDEAAGHFDAAVAMNARMGALPWTARTQLDYARALLERPQPRDPERAHDLLSRCTTTFRQLGMKRCAGDAAALERALPRRHRSHAR
jgi:DNA-binding SARP family transcriptional activator